VHLIIPLYQYPNASEPALVAVWQDPQTNDAAITAGAGFIACIGNTGAPFDLFPSKDGAVVALIEHRARGFMPLPE
jgi:hypothetical protein